MIYKMLFIFTGILNLSVFSGTAQDWVGMQDDSIKKIIRTELPDFYLNTNLVNKSYHYLKYEKSDGMQTMLVFLDDSSKCRYVRNIYDYNEWSRVISKFNETLTCQNDSLWSYIQENREITKEIKKEEWFFTVTTRSRIIKD